jgi:hypothetical protein
MADVASRERAGPCAPPRRLPVRIFAIEKTSRHCDGVFVFDGLNHVVGAAVLF